MDTHRQQVDDLARRAGGLAHNLALAPVGAGRAQARLAALSPQATLERGYAIVRQGDTGAVVRRVRQVEVGDALLIRVQDGELGAIAKSEIPESGSHTTDCEDSA